MTQPDQDTLASHLADVEFPCDRAELLRCAAAAGGGDGILGALGALPPDDRYRDLDAVWRTLSGHRTGAT